MVNSDFRYNRYGENIGKPNKVSPLMPSYQDEYGMNREEEPIDWSNDPRSEAFLEKHYGKGPKDWLSDDNIKERVSESLFLSHDVDAREIRVEVKDGCVTLKGMVRDRNQKKRAERTIEHLIGVIDIRNELMIKSLNS